MEYEYHYEYAWLQPKTNPSGSARPEHNEIQFAVKGCNDAHILLSNTLHETSDVYEIIIGAYSNTATDVRRNTEVVLHKSSPDVMKCDQFRLFWLTWDAEGSITLGTGLVHTHQMLQYTMPEPVLYKYAALSTWDTAALEYQLVEQFCKYPI